MPFKHTPYICTYNVTTYAHVCLCSTDSVSASVSVCLPVWVSVRLCLIIKFNDLIRKLAAIGFVHCCLCRTWFEFIVRFAFQSNAAHKSTTSNCMQLSYPLPTSPSFPSCTPLVTEAAPTDVARGCQSVLPIQLFSDSAVFRLFYKEENSATLKGFNLVRQVTNRTWLECILNNYKNFSISVKYMEHFE